MKNAKVTFRFLSGVLLLTVLVLTVLLLTWLSAGGSGGSSHEIAPVAGFSVTTGGAISSATQTVSAGDTAGFSIASVSGCNSGLSGDTDTTGAANKNCRVSAVFARLFTVTTATIPSVGGSISPSNQMVSAGDTTRFTLTPNDGFFISNISGCNGSLSGNTYTTGAVDANCSVAAVFTPRFTITTSAGTGGTISPATKTLSFGHTTRFTVTPNNGFVIDDVDGCGGRLSDNTYTTGAVNANCSVTATFRLGAPGTPTLSLRGYRLPENADGNQVGGDTAPAWR